MQRVHNDMDKTWKGGKKLTPMIETEDGKYKKEQIHGQQKV